MKTFLWTTIWLVSLFLIPQLLKMLIGTFPALVVSIAIMTGIATKFLNDVVAPFLSNQEERVFEEIKEEFKDQIKKDNKNNF